MKLQTVFVQLILDTGIVYMIQGTPVRVSVYKLSGSHVSLALGQQHFCCQNPTICVEAEAPCRETLF